MDKHLIYIQNIFLRMLNEEITNQKNLLVPINERSTSLLSCLYQSLKENEIWEKITIYNKMGLNFKLQTENINDIPIILFTDILEKESDIFDLYISLKEKGINVTIFSIKESINVFKELKEGQNTKYNKENSKKYIEELEEKFKNKKERHILSKSDITNYLFNNHKLLNYMNELSYSLPFSFTAKTNPENFDQLIEQSNYIFVKNKKTISKNTELNENFFYQNNSNYNTIPNCFHIFKYNIDKNDISFNFSTISLLSEINIEDINKIFNILYKNSPIEQLYKSNNIKEQYYYILLFHGYYQTELFRNYLKQYIVVNNIEWKFTPDEISTYLDNLSLEEKRNRWDFINKNYINNRKNQSNIQSYTSLSINQIKDYLRFETLDNEYTIEDINMLLKNTHHNSDYDINTRKIIYSKILVSMFLEQKIKLDISKTDEYIQTVLKKGIESEIFLEKDMELLIPYFSAYIIKDNKFDEERYINFIEWLKTHFYSEEYMDTYISKNAFDFYTKYFLNNKEDFLKKHYPLLPTKSNEKNKIYLKVDEWKF